MELVFSVGGVSRWRQDLIVQRRQHSICRHPLGRIQNLDTAANEIAALVRGFMVSSHSELKARRAG